MSDSGNPVDPEPPLEFALRLLFIASSIAWLAAGIIGGSYLHLAFAATAALSAGMYLVRAKGHHGRATDQAKAALGCSVLWIVGGLLLALGYGWAMRDFH